MKKLLTLTLMFLLTGCAAIAPVPPTAAPTSVPPTPAVIIATVLVPAPATQAPAQAPTEVPPTQAPQVVVVTATQAAGAAPTQAPSNPSTGGGAATATATLPADFGGNLFTDMTRSASYFNLRCLPQDITFTATTSNTAVIEVDLFYRMEDLTTQPIAISDWKNYGKMTNNKNGTFTLDVNTSMLSPDLRGPAKAWFDYQFIGVAKDGNAVGRSGKISQQILYLKDCP